MMITVAQHHPIGFVTGRQLVSPCIPDTRSNEVQIRALWHNRQNSIRRSDSAPWVPRRLNLGQVNYNYKDEVSYDSAQSYSELTNNIHVNLLHD